jgi:hypothetical protein
MAHTIDAEAGAASVDPREPERHDARFKALVRLLDRQVRGLPAYKLARVLSAIVALACGAAMLALVAAGQSRAVFALAVQSLAWASWTTGVTLGLGSAAAPRAGAASTAVEALVLQRGFTLSSFARAEFLANTLRFALLVGVPSVALGLLSVPLAESLLGAARRALACAGMLGYALLFGVTLVLLARAARSLAPNASRLAFAGFVLGPLLLAELEPAFPSVPGVFAVLREQLLAAGLGA